MNQTENQSETTLSVEKISKLTGKTIQGIHHRAKKESWSFRLAEARGNPRKEFTLSALPSDIQALYYNKVCENALPASGALVPVDPFINSRQPTTLETHLYPKQEKKLQAKLAVGILFAKHMKKAGRGETVRFENDFLTAYNSGQAWPSTFQTLGRIRSIKTIKGWKYKLRSNGGDVTCLADNRGYSRKGKRDITQGQASILFACVASLVTPYKSEIIRVARHAMKMRGMETGPSDDTYRRVLNQFIERNYDKWVLPRYGTKGLDDKCLPYLQRDYSKIGVGDLVTADGHVLNFEIINPWTGKPKRMTLFCWYDMASNYPLGWEIMPTESTQAIHSSLMRALLTAGMFFKAILLDNGGAISSKFFNGKKLEDEEFVGLFARLGIPTIFAWPYHPQSKPVEGFFKLLGEFERLTPSYVGTSIATKPPHLNRGEKTLRALHERLTLGAYPTLEQAHRFIAASFDEYIRRPQTGHLNDKCPLEVFEAGKGEGIDPVHLRFLMMTEVVRSIRRNGIQFLGRDRWYYDPKLYGRKHQVRIRYDLQNQDSILVYDMDDQFICEAVRRDKVHPAASILGSEADVERLQDQIAEKNRLKKQTVSGFKAFAESTLIPEARKRLEDQGLSIDGGKSAPKQLPETASPIDKEQIAADLAELEEMNRDMPRDVVEDDDYRPEIVDPNEELRFRLEKMTEVDRYEALLEMEITGQAVTKEWAFFMKRFEMGDEYQRHKSYFEDRRAMLAVIG